MTQDHPYYPFMQRALALAETARGDTCPNPVVGALLVKDGRVVAEGRHACCGGPHAEVAVLAQAAQRGIDPAECSLVVTLEPCAHHGKTPPCCEAVLAAGIRHVVVGLAEPTPKASGGADFLRAHGVRVDTGVAGDLCALQLADFIFWENSPLPFVTLKLAATLDGAIATRAGEARWITGPAARARVHELRSTVQAVMVGGNTFRQDNPQLTCRLAAKAEDQAPAPYLEFFPGAGRAALLEAVTRAQPLAVVVTDHLPAADAAYYLLQQRAAQTVFLTNAKAAVSREADALRGLGAAVIGPPESLAAEIEAAGLSEATLHHNLSALRRDYGCCRILCEGGGRLGLFLLQHGLTQQFELHTAPTVMGDDAAPRLFSGLNPAHLAQALRLRPLLQGRAGEDMVMLFEPGGGCAPPPGPPLSGNDPLDPDYLGQGVSQGNAFDC